jgi:pimeloyl-ACP methyl ester carboxylesterase
VLIGHSLGGVVAAAVAQQRRDLVRAALLEDPPLFYVTRDRDEPGPLLTMFQVMRKVYGEMQARGAPIEEYEALIERAPAMSGKGTMVDVLGAQGVHLQALSMAGLDPEVFTSATDGTALASAQPLLPLGCPVLVLRAEESLAAAFSADDEVAFLAANPDATVRFVAGASHLIHDDQPERFRDEVEAFLDSLQL